MTTCYLFSLGLVPVQSWIEEARRSRDLRAGSVILWWTMARVLHTLEQKLSAELVLPPAPEGGFKRLGTLSLGQAWHERYGVATGPAGDCPFSLVWVAVPVEERARDVAGLQEDLQRIDRLYSDVKRTRPIRPWRGGAPVPKCNQCGRREAVGPRDSALRWRRWEQESWNRLSSPMRVGTAIRRRRFFPYCDSGRSKGWNREDKAGRKGPDQYGGIATVSDANLDAAVDRRRPIFRAQASPYCDGIGS